MYGLPVEDLEREFRKYMMDKLIRESRGAQNEFVTNGRDYEYVSDVDDSEEGEIAYRPTYEQHPRDHQFSFRRSEAIPIPSGGQGHITSTPHDRAFHSSAFNRFLTGYSSISPTRPSSDPSSTVVIPPAFTSQSTRSLNTLSGIGMNRPLTCPTSTFSSAFPTPQRIKPSNTSSGIDLPMNNHMTGFSTSPSSSSSSVFCIPQYNTPQRTKSLNMPSGNDLPINTHINSSPISSSSGAFFTPPINPPTILRKFPPVFDLPANTPHMDGSLSSNSSSASFFSFAPSISPRSMSPQFRSSTVNSNKFETSQEIYQKSSPDTSPRSGNSFTVSTQTEDLSDKTEEPLTSAVFKSAARATIQEHVRKTKMHCAFCMNNKERERVYTSHNLKDLQGKTVCPVLRNYTCPICGAAGDTAHTLKYCPLKAR